MSHCSHMSSYNNTGCAMPLHLLNSPESCVYLWNLDCTYPRDWKRGFGSALEIGCVWINFFLHPVRLVKLSWILHISPLQCSSLWPLLSIIILFLFITLETFLMLCYMKGVFFSNSTTFFEWLLHLCTIYAVLYALTYSKSLNLTKFFDIVIKVGKHRDLEKLLNFLKPIQ